MLAAAWLFQGANTRLSLNPVDLIIIVLYFVLVLGLGLYLRKFTTTGEEFFMAGREMTAWIAGLSFISANLGSLEMMGYAAATYQYGILVAHAYWIGAIPAILFLGLVMMPFYYICKTHSVPGYLMLRYGDGARSLSAISFAVMTILMSGINMYSMAIIMKVILGWNIHFSIWVSSLTVALYVMAGGLLSAIFNEVLQFFLIWIGCLVVPVVGLIETGGWAGMVHRIQTNFPGQDFTHMWSTTGSFTGNPMGVHWTGIVFGWGLAISFGYWTTDFLVVQRVMAAKDLRSAQLGTVIGAFFKMMVPLIVILPGLLALAVLPFHLVPESQGGIPNAHTYNEALPLMLARYRFHNGMDVRHLQALHSKERVGFTLCFDGPVVFFSGCVCEHRDGIPGNEFLQHHRVCASDFRVLHSSHVRHRDPRHALEANHTGGRILGPPCRHFDVIRVVGLGKV
jgi:SSS family solute:Na+ symporter